MRLSDGFLLKLQNWRRRIMQGNIDMFDNKSDLFQEHEVYGSYVCVWKTGHPKMATSKRVRTYRPKHSDTSLSRGWRINMVNKKKEPLKTSITQHLQSLQTELTRYFPGLKENEALLARNPFSTVLDVTDIPDESQDQFYDLRNDISAHDVFTKCHSPISGALCVNRTHNHVN